MGKSDPRRAEDYIESKANAGDVFFDTPETFNEGKAAILEHIKKTAKRSTFPAHSVIKGWDMMLDAGEMDDVIKNNIPYYKQLESRRDIGYDDKVRVETWGSGDKQRSVAIARKENGRIVTWMRVK